MTSPKRRRMNCNITRILSHDARPGTVNLYCSQILSRSKNSRGAKHSCRLALRSGRQRPERSALLIIRQRRFRSDVCPADQPHSL
ncbi:hypothetical protein CFL29_001407 [Salmonella enterica]|nr:hypothetical protein [Salmonella enterica]ECF6101348.1 hypothetical protein [Salmonella enterica subsp. diarizonae]EDQ7377896.1 hypothetical protein [Salmonella enterica subsp. diarizonae serovar 35:l,v:z35]EDR1379309.1 hypothetical protein [Salmonella enterica subsp. diarizonae serovar 61:r:z53]HAE6204352.1 hypothetical protein [Salmonella enterica subsp. diarizonae serovar 50:l,v:z35]